MKKVLIIDDEAAARKLIKEYLIDFPELILLGEANNGVDAVKMINEFKPDLVFMDVQMPGMSGFDVLTHIEEIPQIIFSTAYDKYALQAFEVHAIDYLLKPYTKKRFKVAIERLNSYMGENKVRPLAESLLMDQPKYPERILVQSQGKLITIAVKDIIRVEAYGDYSKLITDTGVYLSNFGISVLEEKFNNTILIRVHRSSIINLNKVKELNKYTKSYDVIMQNEDVVRVSRGYMDNIKRLMF
ncbi:two-component system LytT family response regulator [Aquimarina sp. EL_43]|uniref:LytR/AlgR family response regulator transcription factor n=1 Tax=Aquimarina TaxID=290174 RepID=UPI000470A697|nr:MULTISPECIES: LytTR family DNA-binding domain-containing protein [Aquimarina]MBG6129199.1 two-component system LytT family response regulator [Aquimarina sp. EL_35]MBG6150264.1 two-component system LytT family response regulator [Aquimarina sp. EL_32]MBG6167051.1 two-component system LytT family response regulator [Aquimarina sp. EL_43]